MKTILIIVGFTLPKYSNIFNDKEFEAKQTKLKLEEL